MQKPLVSILIPTCNQSQYILRTVESALMQDYDNLEIIVSDDSTNNETEQILEKYISDGKIEYHHNTHSLGRVGNYRHCLYALCNGEWAVNLDGDDYYCDSQFVSKCMDALLKGEDKMVMALCGGVLKNSADKIVGKRDPYTNLGTSAIASGTEFLMKFARRRGFLHLCSIYNTKKAKEIGFYRADILSSDLESFCRLALWGKVAFVGSYAGIWNQHGNNASSSSDTTEQIVNAKWSLDVAEYARKQNLWSETNARLWAYLIYRQEMSGILVNKVKYSDHKIKEYFNVLRRYPCTFFFPVFQKKIIFG